MIKEKNPEKKTAYCIASVISKKLIKIAKEQGIKDTVRLLEAGMMAATLEEMENSRGRYAEAARSLHVHINTFRSRLEVLEPEVKKMSKSIRAFKKKASRIG
jgi:alanyl-tRNA synthetase